MKSCKCVLLAIALTLESMTANAGQAMNEAQQTINSSMMWARGQADRLVKADFSQAVEDILNTGRSRLETGDIQDLFSRERDSLEKKLNAIISSYQSHPEIISNDALLSLWNDYTDAVRQRFVASYKMQEQLYSQEEALEVTELAIDKFESTCKLGRSVMDLQNNVPTVPNVPAANINVSLQFSGDGNGGLTSVGTNMSSSAGNDVDRNTIANVLDTTGGISLDIYLNGGSSAFVSLVSAATPYVLAAVLIYNVSDAIITNNEQIAAANDLTDAKASIMMQMATDTDIARFYRDDCSPVLTLMQRLRDHIKNLRGSKEQRQDALDYANSLKSQMADYLKDLQEQKSNAHYYQLYLAAVNNQCLNASDTKNARKSSCLKTTTNFVSNFPGQSDIQLPLDLTVAKKIIDPKLASAKDFDKKYSQEQQMDFLSAQIVLALGNQWNQTESAIEQFSFNEIDGQMKSILNRITLVLQQLQEEQSARWNKPGNALFDEIALEEKFSSLKKRLQEVTADGISVIFERMDREEFRAEVKSFMIEANNFCKDHYVNENVQSFNHNLRNLTNLYQSL